MVIATDVSNIRDIVSALPNFEDSIHPNSSYNFNSFFLYIKLIKNRGLKTYLVNMDSVSTKNQHVSNVVVTSS